MSHRHLVACDVAGEFDYDLNVTVTPVGPRKTRFE
jgi:hypothetical protein